MLSLDYLAMTWERGLGRTWILDVVPCSEGPWGSSLVVAAAVVEWASSTWSNFPWHFSRLGSRVEI